jgi:hypothetical protein
MNTEKLIGVLDILSDVDLDESILVEPVVFVNIDPQPEYNKTITITTTNNIKLKTLFTNNHPIPTYVMAFALLSDKNKTI